MRLRGDMLRHHQAHCK